MATRLVTSVSDINVSFETGQRDVSHVLQDLKTKQEKQRLSFVKLKQKIIATDSVLKSYKQTKEQLEEKEKQLQSQQQEYENISDNYKSLLEKFIPLEKVYDEQKATLCTLQAELQNVNGQKLATEMHAKQLQVLVNNLESEIEVAKVEYQLLKSSHEEEKKNLIKNSKSPRKRIGNKLHSDLIMFGNGAMKAGVLTKRQISLLEKYRKSEETTCPDVEDDVLDIVDIEKSPAYSSNNGILSCRSVDTGRGSSLMSSDDEKISDNVLCELIDDSQINTPLCSPKTINTILDAGLLEAKFKSYSTTATSPIQKIHVDVSTSPIKKLEKQNVEHPSSPTIKRKRSTKQQLRGEVPDTRVNNMLKEMITDYALVSPIPWKDSKDVRRRLPPRSLCNKVEQHRSKLRYMRDRKESHLQMQKAINNIHRKVNKLLEKKNEVRPPNISCLCNSKTDVPKPTEKLPSEEIINLVSRVALQTSNQMNNSIVSTILNTLLPLNIYSSLKVAETDKSQEILKKFMDYVASHEKNESLSRVSLNSFQKNNSNGSSEKTLSGNETIQNNVSSENTPINDAANNMPANTVEENINKCSESDRYVTSIGTLNKNNEGPVTLPVRQENLENHRMIVKKSIESNYNTRLPNNSQKEYPPNSQEASSNCDLVSSKKLPPLPPKSTDIKRKRNGEKNEKTVSNTILTNNKECPKTGTTPAPLMYNDLFGDSMSDCHEETSDEDNSVPLENCIVKGNSPIKKVTKNSKITKLQSLRKSLRTYNRKIKREPSPPPAKKMRPTVTTVQATESNDEISKRLKVSEVSTDVQENFKKAVRIVNEIKNKKLLEQSPVQCYVRRSRKKADVKEQLTNEMKSDKNDSAIEIVNNCDHASSETQPDFSKLNIWSGASIICGSHFNGHATPYIIHRKNSISNEENDQVPTLIEESLHNQTADGPYKSVINYDDLNMFMPTNDESLVHSPMEISTTPENSSKPVSSGKSFFIRMIEKYSSLRKKKTKHCENGKVAHDLTFAIHTCISNILDSTLIKPVPEINKLCDNMTQVKPVDFARAVVETLMGEKQPNDCLCRTYTPPAPPMYKSEQILLYIINKIQKINIKYATIITTILDNIEYKLFRLGSTPEIDQVECLSRFFAVLCRHTKQMRRLRTFVLDAIYCLHFKVLFVFQEVINVWSHIIPTARTKTANDPLVLTIVHLLHFLNYDNENMTEKIRGLLAKRYGYSPGNCNQQQLLKKLDSLVKGIDINDYHNKSLRLAFILIGKRYGPQWCHKHLIKGIITPIVNDTVLEEHIRAFAASLLGPLLRPYPTAMSLLCEMAINKLMLLIDNGEFPKIEEAAMSSVLMLKKYAYNRVVKTLQNWEPKSGISEELENQIKEFVREKQTGAWVNILEKA